MGKESEDKAERILSLYTRLKQGKIIDKERESNEYNVSARTIQRDIADIQCFLQNQNADSGEVQEIVYDKNAGGYVLRTRYNNQLGEKEILAMAKVLLDSRSLMKSEMFPIIHKLIGLCADEAEAKLVDDLLKNEMHHYVELKHGKKLLERIWELENAVKKQQYLEISYKKIGSSELTKRRLKPVGLIFSDFYFYLIAFVEHENIVWRNPDEFMPTIYRIDRFETIEIQDEHFSVPYAKRFEEGEFRKRIQFMHGGKLRKIRMKCKEHCIEAVLDRMPTAEIVRKEDDGYVVQAEVFGNGVDMWVRSQGDNVDMLN